VAGRSVANTNRRFLGSYKGADGIKTGYTNAAGFNLVASAERGGKRIIATVYGGRSSAQRNRKVAELLDLGFSRAPHRVAVNRPSKPPYNPGAVIRGTGEYENASKTIRLVRAPKASPLPLARPGTAVEAPPEELLVAMAATIEEAVTAVEAARPALPPAAAIPPPLKPSFPDGTAVGEEGEVQLASLDQAPPTRDTEVTRIVIERISTSGERHWGINIGRYGTSYQAERVLLQTALTEIGTLDEALRKVKNGPKGFEANFVGMTKEGAARACRRLVARNISCTTIGPS
jgi:D-alanyl-D-alanine carboxypeptidase